MSKYRNNEEGYDSQITCREFPDIALTYPLHNPSRSVIDKLINVRSHLKSVLKGRAPFSNEGAFRTWAEGLLPIIELTKRSSSGLFSILVFFKPMRRFQVASLFEVTEEWFTRFRDIQSLELSRLSFYFKLFPYQQFVVGEMKLYSHTEREWKRVYHSLAGLKEEIYREVQSHRNEGYFLSYSRPSSYSTRQVEKRLLKLLKRVPYRLSKDVLKTWDLFKVRTCEKFRNEHSSDVLIRLVLSLHFMQNRLIQHVKETPKKRCIPIYLIPSTIKLTYSTKYVLELVFGVNFFHSNERLGKQHILAALREFIPEVYLDCETLYEERCPHELILTGYVEVRKKDNTPFIASEIALLKEKLPYAISKRVEHLLPSTFSVRNEEEVMKNIIVLSREIVKEDDLPQVMVFFEGYRKGKLVFNVILLRVKKEKDRPIQELIQEAYPQVQLILSRAQVVNQVKNSLVEVYVFQLLFEKEERFLRKNFSINLYLARQKVTEILTASLGMFRDYNGGMMIKQGELLSLFKEAFRAIEDAELLEDFFYALEPIESQATLDLDSLSILFDHFLTELKKEHTEKKTHVITSHHSTRSCAVIITSCDPHLKSFLSEELRASFFYNRDLTSSHVELKGRHYFSYFLMEDEKEQNELKKALLKGVNQWERDGSDRHILRLSVKETKSIDPRKEGDRDSSMIIHLLFEGLTRIGSLGTPECASAEGYEVSQDKMTWTFRLRESAWSNGDPVTAFDFEYAWKTALSPSNLSYYSWVFDPIKYAKLARQRKIGIDEVGIKALNAHTLVVELEHPCPYFAYLTAMAMYAPVHREIDTLNPDWGKESGERFISNGPFTLDKHRLGLAYAFKKNQRYWNRDQVAIEGVEIREAKPKVALEMFKKGTLDFLGIPSRAAEELTSQLEEKEKSHYVAPKILWLVLNHRSYPLSNVKLRRALTAALNRHAISGHFYPSKKPALTPLPMPLTYHERSDDLIREDHTLAKKDFKAGLKELKLDPCDLPPLHFLTFNNLTKLNIAKAIMAQWKERLGVECSLESYETKELNDKLMGTKDFQIATLHWTSWVHDPIETLNVFRHSFEDINFSGWENEHYQYLLHKADWEIDPRKRQKFLREAERLLIRDAVVIPLFYENYVYLKNPSLTIGSSMTPSSGCFDFSRASFHPPTTVI